MNPPGSEKDTSERRNSAPARLYSAEFRNFERLVRDSGLKSSRLHREQGIPVTRQIREPSHTLRKPMLPHKKKAGHRAGY